MQWLRYLMLFFVTCCAIVHSQPPPPSDSADWQSQVTDLDKRIKSLQELKGRYEGSALRHENNAMRWQFEDEYKLEARRAYSQAEFDREVARKIQSQIDDLNAQRAEILQQHPEGGHAQTN